MTITRKILFISNPVSGNNASKPDEALIRKFFKNDNSTIEFTHTKYQGHATELTQKAVSENFDVVVAIGGDGTVNEIATALMNTGKSLGIIPCGSGNGLARHHKIPFNLQKALQIISNNNVILHDSIQINNNYSFNVSGIGFDAHIAHLFGKDGKRGFASYAKLVVQEFHKYKEFEFTIIDGVQKQKMIGILVAIANASQFGNNVRIAPMADTNDGKADITVVRKMKFYQLPFFAYRVFNGSVTHSAFAEVMNTKKITINCEKEIPLHVDGEPAGFASSYDITSMQSSLKLIVP